MTLLPPSARMTFPGISSRAYEHPADRAALTALRKLTGFDTVLRKVLGLFGERRLRLLFLANGVRVSNRQVPRLYSAVADVCRILDVSPVPETFVVPSPFKNGAAIGVDQPILVFNNSLIESLNDEELMVVVAHEVGHVLSGHALYKTLLIVLLQAARWVAATPVGMIALPIILGLKEWERKAELSSDRAALLVSQDLAACQRVMMKLAGVPGGAQFDITEFEAQARDYRDGGSVVDNLFKIMNLLWISHPFPVHRLLEVRAWAESDEYRAILAGSYPRRSQEPESKIHEEAAAGARTYREDFGKARDSLSELVRDLGQVGGNVFRAVFSKRDGGSKTGTGDSEV